MDLKDLVENFGKGGPVGGGAAAGGDTSGGAAGMDWFQCDLMTLCDIMGLSVCT